MAARFKTVAHTIGAAAALLSDILASPGDSYLSSLTFRAKATNAGNVNWTDTDDAIGGYLDAGEAASFDLAGKFVASRSIKLAGTENDIVYITAIG